MVRLVCAGCQGEGKSACKNCLLVLYCGAECQKKHWSVHKQECKSPLIKETWQPSWQAEGRPPHFIGDGPPMTSFGAKKYLWGNVPAIDVLKLDGNEGADFSGDLSLLFAASGDPRNVIKTIASLPKDYSGKVSATVNDIDFDIVARNTIIFLIALTTPDVEHAVDCIIHTWYSAAPMQSHIDLIQGPVRKLVEEVCLKIADKSQGAVLGKTWTLDSGNLRLVLTKAQWMKLLQYFDIPKGVDVGRASSIWRAVTMAPERRDFGDRAMFTKPGPHRLASMRFREDGILLPFACSRHEFIIPNPTIFQSNEWPMMDSSDPLEGWDFNAVLNTSYGPASKDVHSKLYKHICDTISSFCDRVKSLGVSFKVLNVDAKNLHLQVEDGKFACIEVCHLTLAGYFVAHWRIQISNISDLWCLGPAGAVGHLSRFLQPFHVNNHAALLTLFLNATREEMTPQEDQQDTMKDMAMVVKYLPMTSMLRDMNDPRLLMTMEAREMFRDNDKYFDRYMKTHKFKEIERYFGVVIK